MLSGSTVSGRGAFPFSLLSASFVNCFSLCKFPQSMMGKKNLKRNLTVALQAVALHDRWPPQKPNSDSSLDLRRCQTPVFPNWLQCAAGMRSILKSSCVFAMSELQLLITQEELSTGTVVMGNLYISSKF